jgi:hypothetical protein
MLGISAYDVKVRLAGPLPRILTQTPDEEVARRLHRQITGAGHGVLVYDPAAVVPTSRMTRFHRFTLDTGGVWANDQAGERLEWADVAVVVVATLRSNLTRTTDEVEYQMGTEHTPSRVTRKLTKTEQASSHAAFFFPRVPAKRPWLLDETTAQFVSLGRQMQPTRHANFFATVEMIRRLVPGAIVDDRYVNGSLVSQGLFNVRGRDSVPPVVGAVGVSAVASGQIDLTVHALATWLMRDRTGPYR